MLKANSSQQGMVLLEALIALVIFSFGILALVGLQAAMMKNTGSSKYRSDASYIAQKLVGQMWADSGNLITYTVANQDISSQLPGGKYTVELVAGTQYKITVGWAAPGEATDDSTTVGSCANLAVAHCFVTVANIAGA